MISLRRAKTTTVRNPVKITRVTPREVPTYSTSSESITEPSLPRRNRNRRYVLTKRKRRKRRRIERQTQSNKFYNGPKN